MARTPIHPGEHLREELETRESTAIPVPEKVFEDMRSCSAGVIHVGGEGKYIDPEGHEHTKLNDNVLIEIGAAMRCTAKKSFCW